MVDDRRHTPRITLDREVTVTIGSHLSARLVDISIAGVHLELGSALHPTHACQIAVPLPDGSVKITARVAHCKATGMAEKSAGGGLVYRAGLEFVDIDRTVTEAIMTAYAPRPAQPVEPIKPVVPERPKRHGPIKIKVNVDALEGGEASSKHGAN